MIDYLKVLHFKSLIIIFPATIKYCSMKKCLYLLPILLLGFSNIQGQVRFEHVYDTLLPGNTINDIMQTYDNGYIATGVSRGMYQSLIRLDENGDTLWTRRYITSRPAIGHAVKQTPDSGFIMVGNEFGYNQPIDSGCINVIKTDAMGNPQWSRCIGEINGNAGFYHVRVVSIPGGNYIVGGNLFDPDSSSYVLLLKLNSMGDTIWTKRYYGIGIFSDLVVTYDQGICMVSGHPAVNNSGSILKVDLNGNILWNRRISGYQFQSICQRGNDLLVASVGASQSNPEPALVYKFDSVGTYGWGTSYSLTILPEGEIQSTADSGFIIIGKVVGSNNQSILAKMDYNSDTVWARVIDAENSFGSGYCVSETNDGGYIFAGLSGDGFYSRSFIIKTDSLGMTPCSANNSSLDITHHTRIVQADTIVINSGIQVNNVSYQVQSGLAINPYCGITSIGSIRHESILLYPNPSDGNFYLSHDYKNGFVEVITLEGKLLMRKDLIKSSINELSIRDHSPGLYLIRIITDEGIYHRKIILE